MTFKELKELKTQQQEKDRKAMKEGLLTQEDLSLFKNMDLSKVKITYGE